MKLIYIFLISWIVFSCNKTRSGIEKYQRNRKNILDVRNQLVDLKIDPKLMFGGKTVLYPIKDYLIICDHQNPEKGLHLFKKSTFEYITSTGLRGHGPNEIIRYGHIGVDNKNGVFYVTDFGKMVGFKFVLDSVLENPDYMPTKNFSLIKNLFPAVFSFVSDSVLIGKGLDVIDNQNFNSTLVSYNIRSESIKKIGEPNPDINARNISTYFALSTKNNICVETFANYDLMTIRDLDGNTLTHVYGPQWKENEPSYDYYYITDILGDKIFAAFLGAPGVTIDRYMRNVSVFPTKLMVFDIHGNYLHTLETGSEIFHFCVDETNNRLIIAFYNRDVQFAYLDLNELN